MPVWSSAPHQVPRESASSGWETWCPGQYGLKCDDWLQINYSNCIFFQNISNIPYNGSIKVTVVVANVTWQPGGTHLFCRWKSIGHLKSFSLRPPLPTPWLKAVRARIFPWNREENYGQNFDNSYLFSHYIICISKCIQVVPGRAGGGSFKRKKNYIAKKEFAYRMCARWPTIALSKLFVWVWTKLLPLHGCDVMTCFQVMWLVVRWFVVLLRYYSVLQRPVISIFRSQWLIAAHCRTEIQIAVAHSSALPNWNAWLVAAHARNSFQSQCVVFFLSLWRWTKKSHRGRIE